MTDRLGDEDGDRFENRLQDRFADRRLENLVEEDVPEGSTRLRDRAETRFEMRRRLRQQREAEVREARDQFADALDLDPGALDPIQLDDRGEEIGFVPGDRGVETLSERFARDRPFVEPADAFVDADPREGVRTRVDPDRKDEVADRAREEAAADADFITGRDLDAEVGPGGVEDIRTREDRRDDIADRARDAVAGEDPFAEPGDIGVDVGPRGIDDLGFTDTGAQRRAGRVFADQTPLDDVGVDDVRPADDGFTLTADAQRRSAARGFEEELDQFGPGELDPQRDVRDVNGGFGLAEDPAREVAADRIDREVDELDVGPGDIDVTRAEDGSFEATFEREVER